MSLTRLLDSWTYFLDHLHWLLIATLGVLVLVQLGYYIYLNTNVMPRATRRRRRRERLPDSPVMPTDPDSSVNVNYAVRQPDAASPPELTVRDTGFVAKMVILSGLPNVSEIELPGDQFGIGRFYNPEKDIFVSLDERSVSRRHAVFHGYPGRGEFYLMDASSSYGTSVRRGEHFEPLTPGEEERVYNGDVVQFGSAVTVRLVLPGDTRAHATQL